MPSGGSCDATPSVARSCLKLTPVDYLADDCQLAAERSPSVVKQASVISQVAYAGGQVQCGPRRDDCGVRGWGWNRQVISIARVCLRLRSGMGSDETPGTAGELSRAGTLFYVCSRACQAAPPCTMQRPCPVCPALACLTCPGPMGSPAAPPSGPARHLLPVGLPPRL